MSTSLIFQSLVVKAVVYGSLGVGVYVFSDWWLSGLALVTIAALYAAAAMVVDR